MLAAVIQEPGVLEVQDVPMPTIDETECLVEILACGICNGTDRKLLDGHFRYKGADAYPGILGHEGVGRVVECGAKVESFEVDDIVLRPGAAYPPHENVGIGSIWGGMAQFGKIKDPIHGGSPLYQIIPPDIDPVEATMLITLKETLSWLQRWPVAPGQSVLVLGSGPVGVSFAFFAKLLGCGPVILLGRRDDPLARAMALGVDAVIDTRTDDPAQVVRHWTRGKGVDRVIEAVGDDSMVELGLSLMASGGKVGIYGITPTREPGDMQRNCVNVGVGRSEWCVEAFGPREEAPHDHLLWLVDRGFVRLRDYFTHVVSLQEVRKGFELLAAKEAFKVVVRM